MKINFKGYAYSLAPNPWAWLTSQEAAEAMAEEVATWRELYNVDGIDLDIEAGAGDRKVRKYVLLQPSHILYYNWLRVSPLFSVPLFWLSSIWLSPNCVCFPL